MFVFQCSELLSRVGPRSEQRCRGIFLRQTGRVELWKENQGLLVPMVTTDLAVSVYDAGLCRDARYSDLVKTLDCVCSLTCLSVSVTVRAGRFSHCCAKVRSKLHRSSYLNASLLSYSASAPNPVPNH